MTGSTKNITKKEELIELLKAGDKESLEHINDNIKCDQSIGFELSYKDMLVSFDKDYGEFSVDDGFNFAQYNTPGTYIINGDVVSQERYNIYIDEFINKMADEIIKDSTVKEPLLIYDNAGYAKESGLTIEDIKNEEKITSISIAIVEGSEVLQVQRTDGLDFFVDSDSERNLDFNSLKSDAVYEIYNRDWTSPTIVLDDIHFKESNYVSNRMEIAENAKERHNLLEKEIESEIDKITTIMDKDAYSLDAYLLLDSKIDALKDELKEVSPNHPMFQREDNDKFDQPEGKE